LSGERRKREQEKTWFQERFVSSLLFSWLVERWIFKAQLKRREKRREEKRAVFSVDAAAALCRRHLEEQES